MLYLSKRFERFERVELNRKNAENGHPQAIATNGKTPDEIRSNPFYSFYFAQTALQPPQFSHTPKHNQNKHTYTVSPYGKLTYTKSFQFDHNF